MHISIFLQTLQQNCIHTKKMKEEQIILKGLQQGSDKHTKTCLQPISPTWYYMQIIL